MKSKNVIIEPIASEFYEFSLSFIYRLNTELLLYTLYIMWFTPLVSFEFNRNFIIIYQAAWVMAGKFILLKDEEE